MQACKLALLQSGQRPKLFDFGLLRLKLRFQNLAAVRQSLLFDIIPAWQTPAPSR